MSKKINFKEKNIHILVDSENFNPYLVKSVLTEVKNWGKVSVIKAFGNFNEPCLSPYEKILKDENITKISLNPISKLKNGADIALAVEAMKIFKDETPSTLVLLTSDSDYSYLIDELKNNNIELIGIGEEKTAKAFQEKFNTFIYAEVFPEEYFSRKRRERRINNIIDKKLHTQLKKAIFKTKDSTGYANVAKVGAYLKDNCSFNVLNYGYKKLTHLLKNLEEYNIKQEEKIAFVSLRNEVL